VGGSSCSTLGDGVTCTDESIEPGEVAVCDLACERDSDCGELGDAYECDSGFCRHDPGGSISSGGSGTGGGSSGGSGGTSSGSGGASSGSGGSSSGSGGGNGGSCEVLFMEFADGETGISDPLGCGTCECNDGDLVCTDEDCASRGAPVFQCPLVDGNAVEPQSDDIDIIAARIEGDTLVLQFGHSGGCAEHDYGLCYMASFDESAPVQGSLQLIHDGHGDACEAYLQSELRFDLTPYGDYYVELYGSGAGEIATQHGNYVFGDLDCRTRSNHSELQLSAALDMTGTVCQVDEDCVWYPIETGCSPLPICGGVVGLGHELLDEVVANLFETFCVDFGGQGCTRENLPRQCPGPAGVAELRCEAGECVQVAP
jgi:hypothetical protein